MERFGKPEAYKSINSSSTIILNEEEKEENNFNNDISSIFYNCIENLKKFVIDN